MLEGPKFDPSLRWQVIQTSHFRVYFHQGEETLARKAARIAEEAHAVLVPRIGWEPAEPTHIVLADNLDVVSGGATPFPNNTIYLSPTSPLESPIPFWLRYDDWLRDVITHEYVHILHLDTNGGFPSVSRTLFGRAPLPLLVLNGAFPNLLQPDWLIEGLATYEESATGVSDRRDNAYAEMLLRMAILEDRFPSLDQGGGRDTWPDHQVEYLFGARFYDYLARRFGEGVLKDLSHEYSNNAVPFFVGSTGRQVLGQSYDSLWRSWKGELKIKYEKERQRLEQEGLTESRPITHQGDYVLGPRVNPVDGRIVYTAITPHEYPALRVIDPATGQDRFLRRRNLAWTASWSPDGKTLAFSQLEVYRNYSQYSDIFLYDLPNEKMKRLTRGARLRDPDFHPDGDRLICVENRGGHDRLVILDLKTGRREVLDWLKDDLTFWHPRWSPDGKSVAVSVWKEGAQGIYLIHLEERKVIPLLMDRALDLMPAWSPDGRYLIFTSDRTGIYNLFACRMETAELFQITRVLGGAFTPEVTPDGKEILFASYGSRGFDLLRMAWNPADWKNTEMPNTDSAGKSGGDPVFDPAAPETYSPWPTVRPRFWTPILGADESGLQVGAATGGMDVLGRHKFNIAALYGDETRRGAYSVQYLNDSFRPTFHLGASDLAVGYANLWDFPNADYSYWERRRRLDLEMILPWSVFQRQQSLTLGYRYEWLSGLSGVPPGAEPPGEGGLSGVRLSWRFSTAKEYGFSISREEGRLLQASYIHFDHRLGSDFDQNRYVVAWYEYLELFRHHVLGVRLNGGMAAGDRMIQRAFQVGGPTLAEALLDPDQTGFFLRGYPARLLRGQRAAVGSVEYRVPLYNLERGISTWPFFFRRVHAALFYDVGNAWDGDTTGSDFRGGIGSEIKMDLVFGHRLPLRLRLGFAEGLNDGGERQIYFTVGDSF